VLDAGRFQAELGVADGAWSRGGGTSTDDETYGALELRLGLTSTSRARWLDRPRAGAREGSATGDAATAEGAGDLGLALRWSLMNPAATACRSPCSPSSPRRPGRTGSAATPGKAG
jgi:hypothetical protein